MDTVYNDRLLFERISEGDEHAFKQLFEAYVPRLKAYFFKLTRDQQQVQELVQETFLNVWVYRNKLASIENPSAYLYKIAANLTATWFRKMDLERQLVKAAPAFTEEEAIEPLVSIRELRQQIDTAVLSLPQQQKNIFILSRQEGLTRREIAQRLNLSENTVRNHLTLALNSIQEHLKNYHSLFIPLFLLEIVVCNYLGLLADQTNHDWYENRICRMGATLWERPDLYIKNSPVFYAHNVTTPILTVSNKNDRNVLFEQGLEWFIALRRVGKRVWMLQNDNGNHGLSGNDYKDYLIRMTQFFDHYLKDSAAPSWMVNGIPAKLKGIDHGLKLVKERDKSGKWKTPQSGVLLRQEEKDKLGSLRVRKPMSVIIY